MTEISTFLNTGIPLKSLELVKKHERMIEILEFITRLERRKRDQYRDYEFNRADTLQRGIDRLYLMYYRMLRETAGVEREEGE